MFGVVGGCYGDLRQGQKSEEKEKSFDGALKTVLEFKAQLIAAKSGKQRKTSV